MKLIKTIYLLILIPIALPLYAFAWYDGKYIPAYNAFFWCLSTAIAEVYILYKERK